VITHVYQTSKSCLIYDIAARLLKLTISSVSQVIIEGFKSYKDQTAPQPFSSRINVVLGSNGAGKSNFFHAIRFVLTDITSNTGQEERRHLLHEGAGQAVMSAYVELVFDNSDGRWPNDRDEVRLRRTIGLKKDEYSVDRKTVTKAEVKNLLETAGFSAANPYYVVRQGEINKLAGKKDAERLELLKEIGGTRVYEERRAQSQKLLKEGEVKQSQIEELIEQLDFKLSQLNEEREELQKYQQLDKQRRCLEYTVYDRDITDVKTKLDSLESERESAADKAAKAADESREARLRLKELERTERTAAAMIEELTRRFEEVAAERQAAITRKAQLEIELGVLEEKTKAGSTSAADARKELEQVKKNVVKHEKELTAAQQRLKQVEQKEGTLAEAAAASHARLTALYAKQGGEQAFSSKAERDKALKKEIGDYEKAAATRANTRALTQTQAQEAEAEVSKAAAQIKELEQCIAEQDGNVTSAASKQAEVAAKRDQLQNQQKTLWKQEVELETEQKKLAEEKGTRMKIMEHSVPREVARGLNSVIRLVKEHNIQGVYGTLLELFSCKPHFNTAVEVVGGNSLFHIVVKDDAIATRLTELLNKGKCGRATFMPLNRLRPPTVNYPEQYGKEVEPMIKYLKFDQEFKPAMQQTFGKVLLCRNLDLATRVSKECGLTCVTIEGDQVERRGALRGGFVDDRRSRIEAMREVRSLEAKHQDVSKRLEAVRKELNEVGQAIVGATGELAKLESRQSHAAGGSAPLRSELRSVKAQYEELQRQAAAKAKHVEQLMAAEAALQTEISARKALIGTELGSELTNAEKAELADLQAKTSQQQEQLVAAKSERLELTAQLEGLQELLSGNLRRRQRDLEDRLADTSGATAQVDNVELAASRERRQSAENDVKAAAAAEEEIERDLKSAETMYKEASASREATKEAVDRDLAAADDGNRALEVLANRRTTLNLKKSDLERKIRELGSLPSDAFEKYRHISASDLQTRLRKVNNQLKDFGHVNRKALAQFVDFNDQKDELAKRKIENDRSADKIHQLISTLDMRKDEAIERTFRQVARNFREIFSALVPGGRGDLVMLKRMSGDGGGEDDGNGGDGGDGGKAEENEAPGNEQDSDKNGKQKKAAANATTVMDKYSGVKVKVSFAGSNETMSMKQLSGGQRTLVALTLIFAIQRCDPAPFYLFDEIDAALDPAYRTTVADMLRKQARDAKYPAQFIVTTFHPQIVTVADNIYGVRNNNRISKVDLVTMAVAMDFLSSEQRRQEAAEKGAAAVAAAIGANPNKKARSRPAAVVVAGGRGAEPMEEG
jgi:structural maintenance of chromosome 3 (chondroitin sulfate proteoglycan 6)